MAAIQRQSSFSCDIEQNKLTSEAYNVQAVRRTSNCIIVDSQALFLLKVQYLQHRKGAWGKISVQELGGQGGGGGMFGIKLVWWAKNANHSSLVLGTFLSCIMAILGHAQNLGEEETSDSDSSDISDSESTSSGGRKSKCDIYVVASRV